VRRALRVDARGSGRRLLLELHRSLGLAGAIASSTPLRLQSGAPARCAREAPASRGVRSRDFDAEAAMMENLLRLVLPLALIVMVLAAALLPWAR
jgi:hypothetical protein